MSKNITVYTNDPNQKILTLELKAFIKQSIYLSRKSITLQGMAGQTITQSIEVKAGEDKPLILKPTFFDLDQKVSYQIEEIIKGKIYKIHFTHKPGPVESYSGSLTLETNFLKKPQIKILIWGNFTAN